MLIRDLIPADAEVVAQLHAQTWEDTYRGMLPSEMIDRMNVTSLLPFWQKELVEQREDMHRLGALDHQGEIIGWCVVGKARDPGLPETELWAINIPKKHQGLGAGKALMLEAMRRVHQSGQEKLYLWVVDQNQNAIDFYLRCRGQPSTHEKMLGSAREIAIIWTQLGEAIKALT